MPAEAWTFHLPSTGQSAAAVPWARLREVEVHHVDLGRDYSPADWSDAFALRLLREIVGGAPAGRPRWCCARTASSTRSTIGDDRGRPGGRRARPARSPPGWPAAATAPT